MQQVPQPFLKLVAAFYQGSDVEYASAEQWVDSRLLTLTAEERSVVARFLDGALGGQLDPAGLQDAWDQGNSCYMLRGDGLVAFLNLVSDRMRSLKQ